MRCIRVLALVATTAIGATATWQTVDDRSRADDELAAALDDRAEAATELRDATIDVANAQTRLAHLRGQVARLDDETAAAATTSQEHAAAIAEVVASIEAVEADLTSTAASLEQLSHLLGIQQEAIQPLRACVAGVGKAATALTYGDHGRAAQHLDATAEACLAARDARPALLFPYDFPDPHVVRDGNRWYAYATNSSAGAVQMLSSTDLGTWRVAGNALAGVPGWAEPGATWAPSVIAVTDRWLLFYTVRERASGLQCISVATAPAASGPFVDETTEPLVCERDEGGSIDPHPIRDGDRLVLLWKTELDTLGQPAELRGAPLEAGGTAVAGEATTLLAAAAGGWEGRTIEAPTILVADGVHLLYSANSWASSAYAVGAARCDTVLGPCTRTGDAPVLRSDGARQGPGGLSVFQGPSGPMAAYHAWAPGEVGYPHNRYLHLARIDTSGDSMTVHTG